MKTERLVYLIIISLIIVSCTPTAVKTKGSYLRLVPHTSDALEASTEAIASIKIFYQQKPDFDFSEIGIVEALAYGSDVGLNDLFPELKKQAVLVGGTAIHKIEIKRHNQTGDTMHAIAIAIVPK